MPLEIGHEHCLVIEKQEGSPFYLLDPEAFARNFQTFKQAFESHYSPVRIGYSYKTNYIPYLCKLTRELGGHAEVVSRLEYDLALRIGQAPERIIFNGPVKRLEDIELALSKGSLLHIDSFHELEMVLALARTHPHLQPRVGLRVNSCLTDAEGASHIQEGLSQSRFGFPVESLRVVGQRLREIGIPVRALHGHTSSSSRKCWIFERIAERLCEVARTLFPESIEQINLGGGFFGTMPPGFGPSDAPTYEDYARAVGQVLRQCPWVRERKPILVLEPGVALVANALSFITRVHEIKKIGERLLAVVDGNIFHTKPSMHNKPQPYRIVAASSTDRTEQTLSVTGSTCMEKDYLLSNIRSMLTVGDFIRIDNVGAYTIVMSPTFIHPAPAIVARGPSGFYPVRRRQTLDQAFAAYIF